MFIESTQPATGEASAGNRAEAAGVRPRLVASAAALRDLRMYADLRRAHDPYIAEIIRERCRALNADDRATVSSIVLAGATARHIAALTGQNERSLRRKVRRILRRVLSVNFAFVVAHQREWTMQRRRVGQACFIDGLSLRGAAAQLGIPLHGVRKHHHAISCMAEQAKEAAKAAQRRGPLAGSDRHAGDRAEGREFDQENGG